MSGLPPIPLQFADLGNALSAGSHARYYTGRARIDQAEEERKREAQQYVDPAMKGDSAAMGKLAYGDPKAAVAITTALGRMDANKRAMVKERAEYAGQAANAILQANPADRPAIYKQHYDEGVRRGYDMSNLPPEYTPQIDAMLRSQRQMAIPIVEWFKQEQLNQRHNTPGGGGGPTQIDMPGPGAPVPMPAPANPGRPSASLNPAGGGTPGIAPPDVVRATSVAQAPQDNEPAGLSAPPDLKNGPKRNGAFFEDEPTQFGYVQRGVKDRYGNITPMTVEGGYFVYRNPQTNEHVLYKPQKQAPTERVTPPPGFRWVEGQEGRALEFIPGGPHDPNVARRSGPMTEGQSNAALYADRMRESNAVIERVGKAGLDPKGKLLENVPLLGNYGQSDEYQLYEQARRDFINAVLRRESGAVISDAEFANAEKQYFPRPGDKPETLKQKAANRLTAIEGLTRAAGPTYKPAESKAAPSEPAPSAPVVPPVGRSNNLAMPRLSPEEAAKLPPGTPFVGQDGIPRVRR